ATPSCAKYTTKNNAIVLLSGFSGAILFNSPSFESPSTNYGVNGDRVVAIAQADAATGQRWYKVRFDSGVERWLPASVTRGSSPAAATPVTPQGPKYGELLGASGDRINVRSSPSTSASTPHYGVPGDPVQILEAASGTGGFTWYKVAFESGAEGWIREDLVGFP
ncbi:MAG: SH3 domain-containing protein, partial [Cyanobacteria bacterium J06649_4]